MRLDALLQRFPMRLERPPELWEAETDEAHFVDLVSIMQSSMIGELVLNVNNVVVQPPDDGEPGSIPEGEFVAVTVRGTAGPAFDGVDGRLMAHGARHAYTRRQSGMDSVTAFLNRCVR